jgi:sphingomyelin phosphodiesterase acid-like 3
MISDVHFDPFHDPAKVPQLIAAPVEKWSAILASAPSSNQQQAFEALQQQCHARGIDTPYILLQSALGAMHSHQPNAKFMTVSGDLIAHAFPCRYKALAPNSGSSSDASAYQAFVLKTIAYVLAELRASFPGMPIYAALGNNDSGCADYQLDTGSQFLSEAGKILASGLPAAQRPDAIQQFAAEGNYSVSMAAPMRNTRLIVINDLYLSAKYTTCGGAPNPEAGKSEIDWLQAQLKAAKQSGQQVWIMGHIPPGVNPYSTIAKQKNICANAKPEMFLATDRLADTLIEYRDLIHLGIFAHTHMDELRLFGADAAPEMSAAPTQGVVIKMVSSISPVDGNNPSFTVASINPIAAVLQDYQVIAASNQTGIDTKWSQEYDYAKTYHEPQFSPGPVKDLIGEFQQDRDAKQQISIDYIRNYFVGDRSSELQPFWSQYVCALTNATAKSYAACVCTVPK